ncbi:MAG: DNA-directed RNA polymerase subunit P [Candidatus Parvarchaeota archaeon]|jgi:DNA-directed RNA polymerase subunit RPC12/RpoP|nr:DNA-directed RNA polymerase subunit P [Candidatus Parvarchaeota archaeon]MCL5100990.1 DNA-directed RNA polymerase subunit P [Candidatus Parvarchaeota archaeon]
MTKYACFSCGATVDATEIKELIRCPYCGGRVLIKKRPEGGHHVRAR